MLLNTTEIELKTCENMRTLYDDFVLEDVAKENVENKPDGKFFRKHSVYVSKNGEIIHSGLNPEEEIIQCMSKSLEMINDGQYNFLIRVAVFHYMFGYIHPFYDGNGRMSRFISSYLLTQKLHFLVSCRLTCAIKDNLASYYKSFHITNDDKNRGDLTPFVLAFLDTIIVAEEDLYEALIERKAKLAFYTHAIEVSLLEDKLRDIALVLVQNTLFGSNGLSIYQICEVAKVGTSKARDVMKQLENKGLIRKSKEGKTLLYDIQLEKITEL